jgi:hypothetical protein
MPPRFEDCHVNTMKHTMLPRMPECRFTEKDIERLTASTKLSRAQIEVWADHFRRRIPGAVQRETYLKHTEKEKVTYESLSCFATSGTVLFGSL